MNKKNSNKFNWYDLNYQINLDLSKSLQIFMQKMIQNP